MTDLAELLAAPAPAAAPGTYPVPAGRGRWRLTLHRRVFGINAYPSDTGLTELVDARSRHLELPWSGPASLTFVVDGHSPTAAAVLELQTDVIAWRWDDQTGVDVPMFRGLVTHSEDAIGEESHTVTFTCHDYLALMQRRIITKPTPIVYAAIDQDTIVANLLALANRPTNNAGGDVFWPGSSMPLQVWRANPDGTPRAGLSGQLRDRTYTGQTKIGDELDNLSKVINGFDYDVLPRSDLNGVDFLRVFYPQRGVARPDISLIYGSTISTVTRSVSSSDYANYVRVLGNNNNQDQSAAQLVAEATGTDANNVSVVPVGLWMADDNASDVIVAATLNDKANGDLAMMGTLTPTYNVGLRPGAYSYGNPNLGDTVPLLIASGRLNVNTTLRVLAISYDVGDDGDENVTLTVGRPQPRSSADDVPQLLANQQRQINTLARR